MSYLHEVIFKMYPTVTTIIEDIAYDSENNVIEYDEAAVTSEVNLTKLRSTRNRMLADTDWWVMPDRTATQAQLDYRQALRDITETYTSLDDVVWPEKPE